MDRNIQMDDAFLEWTIKMANNVYHGVDIWYAAVNWADTHPRWVSVKERLPEEGGHYLVSDGTDSMVDIWLYGVGWSDPDNNNGRVTHWMPIVPPRKEDKK